MGVLLAIFILALILFTGLIFYIIKIIKDGNWKISLKVLNILVRFGLLVFIGIQVILTIISLFFLKDGLLILVSIIKQMIEITFFVYIYLKTVSLLENLNNEKIFIEQNAVLTQEIGLNFLYLSVTEIIAGFIFGIILFSSAGSFNVATNNTIFVFVIIGLVLQILSKILYKATEIYNENQLTI